jgi:hypothetical protein
MRFKAVITLKKANRGLNRGLENFINKKTIFAKKSFSTFIKNIISAFSEKEIPKFFGQNRPLF